MSEESVGVSFHCDQDDKFFCTLINTHVILSVSEDFFKRSFYA